MKDYNDLPLKINVLLMAYVFVTFRNKSMNYFELDPPHYISTPGYC